ncbi:hypothetical protein HYFRA_00001120 [Hymenoscyphus fraxineus]|uniref:Uncharacterized protein n=1 Tax=Hymenoscyphus fraxineus TaxID=746836 RepID=A0A9N9KRW2_9HELO|nr:hypothetical protein HYFRA_00001120 [Hymenoscyphus fraxineus]
MPSKPKDKPTLPHKPKDLRKFLQREILRDQLKPPSGGPKRGKKDEISSLVSLFTSTPEEDQNDKLLDQSASCCDVDSIFGDEILTHEEIQKQRLDRFLEETETEARQAKLKTAKSGDGFDEGDYNTRIEELRSELRELAVLELDTNQRERSLIQRQKEALRAEISFSERNKKVPRGDLSLDELNEEIRQLPPPLSPWEMKRLERTQKREAKKAEEQLARALEEGNQSPKTPKRRRDPEEADLDGEELLELHGEKMFKKSKSKKPAIPVGRWRSDIHDYFPESEIIEAEHLFRDMCKEDRMLFRRELADAGEKMVKANRSKRKAALLWDNDSWFGGALRSE